MNYNNKDYWNSLVGKEMKLKEVGWPQWTEAFNKARYQLAAEQTLETLNAEIMSQPLKILEIGCGIGFWTNVLIQKYPNTKYLGVDISAASINNLKHQYAHQPNVQFQLLDIGKAKVLHQHHEFDLVICMEVLLHITDDEAWENALENIFCACKKGATVLISDPFLYWPQNIIARQHNYNLRSFETYKNHIEKNNASIKNIYPRTFLLDNNIDFQSAIALKTWQLFFKFWHKLLCIQNETFGKFLGKLAYAFDKKYIKRKTTGHGNRLMVMKIKMD